MKEHGLVFKPVLEHDRDVHVDGPDQLELIVCTGHEDQDESSENCKCNKYYPSKFQILGSICCFCNHSIRFHRVKPELEPLVSNDTKNESEQNEYKYWFNKFIELQQLYCSTNKNLSFDNNLFIKIYDKSLQALLSFIQSPNYKYVLIKYAYDSIYDEGEYMFETRYQVISLQTMLPVKTDEKLQHSWSFFRDRTQMESGFRMIVWDLKQPATLVATCAKSVGLVNDDSNQSFIERIVNIEFPNIN
jgi:hypothetical protein